ncbi:MAG: lamin tail domain-containing protein [Flavobacteriales bacterium]|nr:lamin tail domain-containing protein [Flavobacteriales bacterium]
MKKFIYTIAAASMMFTSCVKDEIYTPPAIGGDSDVVLNEILSKDPINDRDFIELYNTGDEDIDISGYLINDAADPKGGFVVPDNTIITAKGFYFVIQPELTVSISSKGEDVSLGGPDGTLLDYVECPKSESDTAPKSFGRETDGADTWVNGTTPTPGKANGGAVVDPIVNGFSKLNITNTAGSDLKFDITYEYDSANPTFKSVKLYYSINKDISDADWTTYVAEDDAGDSSNIDANREDIEIAAKAGDDKYSFSIPVADIAAGDVVRYYFRGYTKDAADEKVKDYFSPSQGENFDHDIYSQWTLETVK